MSHLSGAFRRAALALGTVSLVSAATLTAAQAATAPTPSVTTVPPAATAPPSNSTSPSDPSHSRSVPVKVIARIGLNIRFGPTTASRVVGSLPKGRVVWVECRVVGQNVQGNPFWDKIANTRGQWISARFVRNLDGTPRTC
jgi:uncharacterized protein YgiM (DUF1202 family)